jgi:dolichyl-phosphate beta-glucosyltransferase
MSIFLSILIPAFNEEENFKKGQLKKVAKYLKDAPFSYEVVVVDDGSSDKTKDLLENFSKKRQNWYFFSKTHQGKAAAINFGVEKAKGNNVLFTDFDQATPISEVEKLLPFLKKDYDVVIGSREVKGAKRDKEPFYRHLMGKVFNFVVKLILFIGIHDTQCGFKLFKREVIKRLFARIKVKHEETKRAYTGAFDVELLYLAQKKGYKIAEVPVAWRHFHTKRVDPLKDSVRMFFDVLKIRINDLLGKYEA